MASFNYLWLQKIIVCCLTLQCLNSYDVVANPLSNVQNKDHFDGASAAAETFNSKITDFFSIDGDSVKILAETVDGSDNLIYLKLNFTNLAWEDPNLAYLDEDAFSKYIDPLLFTFARPGLSYLLLSLPFDFIPSSVNGLAFAVSTVDINVGVLDQQYFLNLNDTTQLDLMFELVETTILEAGDLNRGSIGEFTTCLDHIEDRKGVYTSIRSAGAALLSNRYPLIQSIHDCRQYDVVSDGPPKGQYWVNDLNLILSICISIFAPLVFLSILPKNPPFKDHHGVLKMTPHTDLPVGFLYVLCHSYGDKKVVRLIRFVLGLILLISLSYIQPIVAYLTNKDDFTRRILALQRFDNNAHYVYFGLTLAYYAIFVIVSFMYIVQILIPYKDGECWETNKSRRCLTGMKLPRELWVPKVDQSFTKSALLYAKFRMTMALDFRVWRSEYRRLWNWVTSEEDVNNSLLKLAFRVASFVVLFIPYTITLLLRFILNSLPVFYIAKQTIWYTKKIPVGTLVLILGAARIPPIVWYFINIFQLSLTGLVTNQFVVLPALAITLGIALVATYIINRYNKEYEVLTTDIFGEVACLRDWIRDTSANPSIDYDHPPPVPSAKNSDNVSQDFVNQGIEPEEISMEVHLYDFIVNEMQNAQKRLALTTLPLLVTTSVGAIAFQFLVYIDNIIPIGAFMFLISPILVALFLPSFYNMISIAPSYDSSNTEHRRKIRNLIIKYYRREAIIVKSICRKTGKLSEALNFHFGISLRPKGPNSGACERTTAEFGTQVN